MALNLPETFYTSFYPKSPFTAAKFKFYPHNPFLADLASFSILSYDLVLSLAPKVTAKPSFKSYSA